MRTSLWFSVALSRGARAGCRALNSAAVASRPNRWPQALKPYALWARRLCDEAGTVAVSMVVEEEAEDEEGGTVVEHMLLDCEDLASLPLGDWVAGYPQVTHLLNPENGQAHPKVRTAIPYIYIPIRKP